jgi:hypothetical protein
MYEYSVVDNIRAGTTILAVNKEDEILGKNA